MVPERTSSSYSAGTSRSPGHLGDTPSQREKRAKLARVRGDSRPVRAGEQAAGPRAGAGTGRASRSVGDSRRVPALAVACCPTWLGAGTNGYSSNQNTEIVPHPGVLDNSPRSRWSLQKVKTITGL